MDAEELKKRTKAYSLRVIRLAASLPKNRIADVLVRQMVRSATSVAANYRAACLARSRAEFASKMGIVQEEADETLFWIEAIPKPRFGLQAGLFPPGGVAETRRIALIRRPFRSLPDRKNPALSPAKQVSG